RGMARLEPAAGQNRSVQCSAQFQLLTGSAQRDDLQLIKKRLQLLLTAFDLPYQFAQVLPPGSNGELANPGNLDPGLLQQQGFASAADQFTANGHLLIRQQ